MFLLTFISSPLVGTVSVPYCTKWEKYSVPKSTSRGGSPVSGGSLRVCSSRLHKPRRSSLARCSGRHCWQHRAGFVKCAAPWCCSKSQLTAGITKLDWNNKPVLKGKLAMEPDEKNGKWAEPQSKRLTLVMLRIEDGLAGTGRMSVGWMLYRYLQTLLS